MKTHHPIARLSVAILGIVCIITVARTEELYIPNAHFQQGEDSPAGWSLQGGEGRWVDREILEVTGAGEDSAYWRCDARGFEPGALHGIRVRARKLGGSGTAIVGPTFTNRDFRGLTGEWGWLEYVFRVPENPVGHYLRLGEWHHTGTVQFDAIRILRALPVHRTIGPLVLGVGEAIDGKTYSFRATYGHRGSNYHRPLLRSTAGFNSDRWTFGGGSEVVYRLSVPGHAFVSGSVRIAVNYHVRGGCSVDVRKEDGEWIPLFMKNGLGDGEGVLDAGLFPARSLLLRLRSSSQDSSFQVNRLEFEGELYGAPPQGEGSTTFAEVEGSLRGVEIEGLTLGEDSTGGQKMARLKLSSRRAHTMHAEIEARLDSLNSTLQIPVSAVDIEFGKGATIDVPIPSLSPGEHRVSIQLRAGQEKLLTDLTFTIPDYHRSDYGERVVGTSADTVVWWCDATHKISPSRHAPPEGTSPSARLSAARGDREAVQIVVRPEKELVDLIARASAFRGPGGATISADEVKILRVHYHRVRHPTDASGVRGLWPDALPPLGKVDVAAGTNQPLWILVHVPRDAVAGNYMGTVSLRAKGWSADVSVRLHVWDFTLPERNHIETAFGFSAGNVYRYHQLKAEADRRRVLDLYFRLFSDNRISPYQPTPLDPIRVQFRPEANPPRTDVDFEAFDRAMTRAVEEYHFTGIRLPIQGMGGGTFHARHEPMIGSFDKTTPEYRALFSSYVGQLESHFREKGWLDLAYIYWFDEPAPRDYQFVIDGMRRLDRYAPGLRRMLTEEPGEALAGSVDIWCPISNNYDNEEAEKRRVHGEKFWWYVCTGPKAPYCTLFIDHPATELRVWLWQTWKRGIDGILVWSSNYWTSSAAFPDRAQNPYEDPMGYVSGYSTPKGTKRHWGNGDGRFIYPPETAAEPGISGPGPVLDGPVSSIRWEMLREGIEDWEYLYLLRDLLGKKGARLPAAEREKMEALLEVPAAISVSRTEFTTDPAPIYEHRAAVAQAIERLVRL